MVRITSVRFCIKGVGIRFRGLFFPHMPFTLFSHSRLLFSLRHRICLQIQKVHRSSSVVHILTRNRFGSHLNWNQSCSTFFMDFVHRFVHKERGNRFVSTSILFIDFVHKERGNRFVSTSILFIDFVHKERGNRLVSTLILLTCF